MSSHFEPFQSWTTLLFRDFYFLPLMPILAYIVYQRFLSPLSSIPGPFSAKLNNLWITYHSWKGDTHRTMIALHHRHGPLVRTGPNEVSVSDLSAIKKIYGAGTKFRKSDWYNYNSISVPLEVGVMLIRTKGIQYGKGTGNSTSSPNATKRFTQSSGD
jgi:hypothetical protein